VQGAAAWTGTMAAYRRAGWTTMLSRVDPAGAQATGSTRLLVEFVAKGAPRQGTIRRERASVLRQARQTENRISGWDAPPHRKVKHW
jgi:hypothetical protein